LLAIGYCTVYASQSGNDVYAPATRVARNIDIAGQSQTITFPQIPPQRAKNVITLPATVSSGLGIIYASTTPTICMTNYDNGGTALMLAPGFCGIWAWQPGNSVYAEAPMVGRTFHVMQALQTMTFPAISPQPAASTYTLPATASSRLPITYASTTPSICTINGEKANLLAPGYCGIYASQAGNIIYKPAPAVGRTFQVVKASQTITFPAISPQPAASTYSLPATTNSGLPITYTSITPSICTISGEVANLLALGYCGIYASQPGNSIYKPAETVGRTFQVVKASQSITFAAIPAQQVNTTYTLTATASSGLPITYTSSTPSICTITGGSANLIATGYCGIYASQPGNSVYSAATTVGRNLQVVP
jgi:hypothetical protein